MKKEESLFANRLRKVMFEKNLTQKELAALAKTKQERISEWLRGVRNPSLSSIKKLANALNVSVNYFIDVNKFETPVKIGGNKSEKINLNSIINLIKKENIFLEDKLKKQEKEIQLLKKELSIIRNKKSK